MSELANSQNQVPRGIEVLVKKASVDAEFRELLFEKRGGAATAIGLELDPAESAMLSAIPQEQLAHIISQTVVPVEQRRVFLGRVASAMIAVLSAAVAGCQPTRGIQPENVSTTTKGIRPDQPQAPSTNQLPPPAPAGIRPDPAQSTPPSTSASVEPQRTSTAGIQPKRP
jgi:hypothetical protein